MDKNIIKLNKRLLKKNWVKMSVICAVALVLLLVIFYVNKNEFEISDIPQNGNITSLKNLTERILLSQSGEYIKYEDFLRDLEKVCPYYIPSGVAYRDCLTGLLEEKEKVAENIYNEIILTTQKTPEIAYTSTQVKQNKDFILNLQNLNTVWKPYRDVLCSVQLSITYGGSNQSGMINVCKIYQTQLYINNITAL